MLAFCDDTGELLAATGHMPRVEVRTGKDTGTGHHPLRESTINSAWLTEPSVVDFVAGALLLACVLAARLNRTGTGRGRPVEVRGRTPSFPRLR